jgi:hypothetical protein
LRGKGACGNPRASDTGNQQVGGELVHDVFPSGLIDPTAHLKTGKSRLSAPLPIDYGFVMLLPDAAKESRRSFSGLITRTSTQGRFIHDNIIGDKPAHGMACSRRQERQCGPLAGRLFAFMTLGRFRLHRHCRRNG